MVHISTSLLDRLLAEAQARPTQEICGLLFGTGDAIVDARECRNIAADPARRFEIDPAALLAAHRAARAGGPPIAGCYHSHPSGAAVPSSCDAEAATADGSLWLILAGGNAAVWRSVAAGVVHGRFNSVVLRSE